MKKYKQLLVLKLRSHQSHIIHPLETKTVSTRLVNRQNWLISYSKILWLRSSHLTWKQNKNSTLLTFQNSTTRMVIAHVCYYLPRNNWNIRNMAYTIFWREKCMICGFEISEYTLKTVLIIFRTHHWHQLLYRHCVILDLDPSGTQRRSSFFTCGRGSACSGRPLIGLWAATCVLVYNLL